jgi:hypothetical protein
VTGETARHREIDWASAKVRGRTLTVNLTGDPSKTWKARMEAVLARLDQSGNPWGRVRPKKQRLKVDDVVEGDESRLRHFLEAAVLQTNTDLTPATPEPDAPSAGRADSADQRMTDAFRTLGDAPETS